MRIYVISYRSLYIECTKMELTVLFNWFSLNELSHDLPEITGKPHAKFGADPKETVAGYWKQINTQSSSDSI